MKNTLTSFLIALLLLFGGSRALRAQGLQPDSVDVFSYNLQLDISHSVANRIVGFAEIRLALLRPCQTIGLDLINATVDSVLVNGASLPNFTYVSPVLIVPTASWQVGDTLTLKVFYGTGGYVESYGWGGFHMDNAIHYNLGVAFHEYPHNFGRAWFPCRDNFHDKASFRFQITSQPGWRAICSGMPDTAYLNPDSSHTSVWVLPQPTPTYLVSVAVAPWRTIERTYTGLYDTYPAIIAFQNHDSTKVYDAYDGLSDILPMYERCFGPYRWGRVGYVATPKGSMEHSTNIGLVSSCMVSMAENCQSVIAHEFSHSWFGNLVTCATSADMWFNEGGASFCEEVAMQALYPNSDYYKDYADANLESVLRTTHLADDGYKPLYGQTPDYTYGSTVYDKGATVWHSLRGYLGDSLFYASLRQLFARNAFAAMDSYQVRDSLSLYSGVNLHDFFQFHVFSPGFVDYVVDSLASQQNLCTVWVSQHTVGTDSICLSNRVPLTFFGPDGQSADRILSFSGLSGYQQFQLPFTPLYVLVNVDKSLSLAAIGDTLSISQTGATIDLPFAHFKLTPRSASDSAQAHIGIVHHWTRPDFSPAQNPEIVRIANRYWTVDGSIHPDAKLKAMFHYVRRGANSNYPSLDYGFFESSAAFDSICLLYRSSASQPWSVLSKQHSGNSNEGYFVATALKTGQYTLAVVDESRISILAPQPDDPSCAVFPNPANGGITIQVGNYDGTLKVEVFSIDGRLVFDSVGVPNRQFLAIPSVSGSCVVRITTQNGAVFHKIVTFKKV